ncbi:MAG: nucleotide exchange factor GrpE [Hyphomicrobiaceae bacterium]
MSNENNQGETPEPVGTSQPAHEADAAGAGPQAAGEAKGPASAEAQGPNELDRLREEASELKDRLLRTHAEMENVRKRLEREKSEIAKFAISKFAKDVVGIGDNVQRAIDAVPQGAAEHDPALKSFLEGVTMIEREFVNVLERHGIKRIDPKGEPFNPHFHQAVMEMPVADVPSGTVTQVFQAGYTIEERVLRPAMVVVAKGGMKPQAPAAEASPLDVGADGDSTEPSAASGHGGTDPSASNDRAG